MMLLRHTQRAVCALVAIGMLAAVGCSDSSSLERADESGGFGEGTDAGGGGGGGTTGGGDDFVPEEEGDFSFSNPAVVGESVYVANEQLNSVAVIDSQDLSIDNRLVGFRPTEIVGPDEAHADSDQARVMVLNEGSNSVSVIDPSSEETVEQEVMRHANAIEMGPKGEHAIAWYDDTRQKATDKAGDLSSVSVVTDGQTYQVAVGFHVRDVTFDSEAKRAVVWTDDGVSTIDLTALDGDSVAPPVPLVPPSLDVFEPTDLEIQVTDDGKYVVTRSALMRGIVLLDVDAKEHHVVPLPEVPTDVDLIAGETPQALVMLRKSSRAVRADIPTGLVNASEALADQTDDVRVGSSSSQTMSGHLVDAGVMADASSMDAGAADTGAMDTGTADTGVPDTGTADTDAADTDAADTDAADTGTADTGMADDADSGQPDAGPTGPFFPESIDNFDVVSIDVPRMGAAVIGQQGATALLYTTVTDEKRIVLYDLSEGEQEVVLMEKEVQGAISDRRGNTFIVYHQKQAGPPPADARPGDPEYIAHRWGVTILDVRSAAKKLVVTEQEPGYAALWAPDEGEPKVYIAFDVPTGTNTDEVAYRNILEANLQTFRTRKHLLPSLPEGIGSIRPAGKVFISQQHPQGRMTFIDVTTADRQTITGYQLNSKIE